MNSSIPPVRGHIGRRAIAVLVAGAMALLVAAPAFAWVAMDVSATCQDGQVTITATAPHVEADHAIDIAASNTFAGAMSYQLDSNWTVTVTLPASDFPDGTVWVRWSSDHKVVSSASFTCTVTEEQPTPTPEQPTPTPEQPTPTPEQPTPTPEQPTLTPEQPTPTPKTDPTPTPTAPGGGVEAATATPNVTLPPTSTVDSSNSGSGGSSMTLALVTLLGIVLGVGLFVPTPKRARQRSNRE